MRSHLLAATLVCLLAPGFALPSRVWAGDYAAAVRATPGLLAHYRFEEMGEVVEDASGAARHARIAGEAIHGVDSAFDGLGRALRLTGSGYVRTPALEASEAVSVELWLNPTGPGPETISALYAADRWQSRFVHFNLHKPGKLEFAINGVSNNASTEPNLIPQGRWTHLVATYEAKSGAQRLFADGRLVQESVASPQTNIRLPAGAIGAWLDGATTRPLIADIDEVAIYSAALPAAQVRAHYLAGKGVSLQPVDFARDVRPLLEQRCFECHGAKKQENELRLDVRDSAMRGGESGEPAIVPYDSDNSHLIALVASKSADAAMPPEGARLTSAEIDVLRNWIDQGASWPDELAGRIETKQVATSHWSFQPIKPSAAPASDDPFVTTGNEVDAFIFVKLREQGLRPSPQADRVTLARRLYLDVHGLPPTPRELDEFAGDRSPQAWQRLVEHVLASPRYGERWASHWLDVIRYGDTHGFEVNTPRPNAWPYRDYVIKSLNDDKPFDRFVQEQIAGDQLGVDAGTGFLVAAPALLRGQVGKDEASIRQARADELHEVIVTVGSGVMGLTIGCARCHNHKFDPVSQRDYYQLQAIFSGLQYSERPLGSAAAIRPAGSAPSDEANGSAESQPPTANVFAGKFTQPEPSYRLYRRDAMQRRERVSPNVFAGKFAQPEPTYRLYRGDAMQRRERVSPDVPAVFGSLRLESTTPDAERRLALAKWLVDPAHPLTARVIVNRVWQHHFGVGLASTPSDFGAMGVKPSHPELLDWLAANFVKHGWSLKRLHQLILGSNTYRQANRPREEALAIDAGSRLLWRFPSRRLEMEPIRDSILATSGVLDLKMGGPGFELFKPNTNYVRVYDAKEQWGPAEWRRMIYAHRVRMAQDGVFGAFDCPDAGQPAPVRSRSTTGIQALNLMNSSFIQQQAELLSQRVTREAGADASDQLRRVFVLAIGRRLSETEFAAAQEVASAYGLAAVCRAVFNSNEFLFLP